MQIDVSHQLKTAVGSIQSYEVNETVNITDTGGSFIRGGIKLIRTDCGILARGALHTEVELTCSRCLGLFSCPLTLNIEEEYLPITDVFIGVSPSLPKESGCFTINENYVLDLTEAIRQYALLVIPMKPLCRENCAGLCPQCGHNLNQGPCHCLTQETDPRWAELSKLAAIRDASLNEQKGAK